MNTNQNENGKVLDFLPRSEAAREISLNSSFDDAIELGHIATAAETTPAAKTAEYNRNTRDGIRLTKLGRRMLIGAGLAGLTAALYLGHEAAQVDTPPQPTETGIMVNIYPQHGEGENQLLLDVARPGVDSEQLRTVVEASENEKGELVQGPISVDTGFLTTDQDVLLQYGVQPQDIQPTQ